ncbi:hypothetical protein OUZ56_030535 [Daphnia magna]|uniref:Secreted protein n=1 Tax=Daphnia magna TaxID=35525 RepID=A0ABQ9ZRK9_9CRUS|nr:hypothetical protein OUZ56_030535 [Daphnia magna]
MPFTHVKGLLYLMLELECLILKLECQHTTALRWYFQLRVPTFTVAFIFVTKPTNIHLPERHRFIMRLPMVNK